MLKPTYNWKRFWCPRTAQINLSDRGYLVNPESEWGRHANPELVGLEAIADVPCLVLLGEPGIGKSQEMENLRKYTETKINSNHAIFELNLRSCTNLKEDLFHEGEFIAWKDGTHRLYLFLDSLDEGLLEIPILATQLVDEFKKRKYRDQLSRLYLRIACRTAVFPKILEEGLKDLWAKENLSVYELAPLRRVDVATAVTDCGLDADAFLREVDLKSAMPFAIKPISLNFLVDIFQGNQQSFPANQRLADLYEEGCRHLCKEQSPSRIASSRDGKLEGEQRLIIAARIAAVTVFARRDAIWNSQSLGNDPQKDVLREALYLGSENAYGQPFPVGKKTIEEVLDTGLFSSRGTNRMGWAHQTYAEFLAAWYLKQHNLNLSQILSLIFHPDGRVIPQLQETVAWLVSMRSDVFQEVMRTDPDVLLQSDITNIDDEIKAKLVEALLILHNQEKLEYSVLRRYNSLQPPHIAEQLKSYICDSAKGQWSRLVAIDIAETCKVQPLQTHLADIALDPSQSYWVRVRASRAVKSIADEPTKALLKPLVFNHGDDDTEDELRGYTLRALYPSQITAKDVFLSLPQPKAKFVGGTYQDFLAKEFGEYLQESDLPAALEWLEKQPLLRDWHYPFTRLSDCIMLKAWQHLDAPEILEGFAKVAYLRIQAYDQVIRDSEDEFKKSLEENDVKRRQLLEAIIVLIPNSEEDPYYLAGHSFYSSITLLDCDFLWLIERFQSLDTEETQKMYARLIRLKFNQSSVEQISCLVETCKSSFVLRAEFSQELEPIELDSFKAKEARQKHLDNLTLHRSIEECRPLLDPSPKERVLKCLSSFESGETSAWTQLCRDMTLMPRSQHYNDEWEPDVITLPGWKEADHITQTRVVAAAKQYIFSGDPETKNWFGSTSFCYSALAGYKAFYLVLEKEPEYIAEITPEIWKKWTPTILSYPNSNSETRRYHEQLIVLAYEKAVDEFIASLMVLIDKENSQHGVRICDQLDCC